MAAQVYRVQMPDGSVARIQANSGDEAMTYATSLTQKPGASQDKGNRSAADQGTYLKELQKQRARDVANPTQTGGALGRLESFGAGIVGPVAGEVTGAVRGAGNAAANLFRAPQDKVSSRAIYEANRDETDEETARETKANPISAGVGSIGSLLYGGGELAKGVGLLKGLAPVAKATAAARAVPAVTKSVEAINAAKALLNPKLVAYGGNVAKAAAGGVAAGGALGFSEGSDLNERIRNAADQAELGGEVGGLLQGVAAPLAKPFAGAIWDAARGVWKAARAPVAEGTVTAADRLAAQQAAGRIAKQAGVTSENLPGKTAPYAGLGQTVAEATGSTGQNTLGAIARRAGTTGDKLRTAMRVRSIGQPQGIAADFREMLGVDPEAAAGDIDKMVEAGRAKAGPEFQNYFDATQGGITSPELERLLATPEGAKQAAGIERFAKNTGRPQAGLTYGRVEVPPEGVGVNPAEAPPVGEFSEAPPPVPRGPSKPPSRGLSLMAWLARQGGIGGSDAGEAQAIGAGKIGARSQMSPQDLETLAQKAQQEGYFPEHNAPVSAETTDNYHRTSGEDFKAALADELAGRNVRFPREADPEAMARYQARAQAELDHARHNQRYVDEAVSRDEHQSLATGTEPPAEGYGGHAPEYEPAIQESLTGEGLDRIRRRANKAVTWEFGKPVRTGPVGLANEEPAAFSEDFTNALKLGPHGEKLAKALETSSDYLGIQSAFNAVKGQLVNGTPRDFGKVWGKLKNGAQQDAARAALASDVTDLWGRGQLKGGKFAMPGIQQKLELAFGKTGAQRFVDQMERRAELAASGSRMAPFSGSPTMSLQEAAGETNAMEPLVPPLARIAGKALSGHPLRAAGDAIKTLAGSYRQTSGMSTGFRNELGRLLSLPSNDPEFIALLRQLEKATPAERADLIGRLTGGRLGNSGAGRAGAVAGYAANRVEPAR